MYPSQANRVTPGRPDCMQSFCYGFKIHTIQSVVKICPQVPRPKLSRFNFSQFGKKISHCAAELKEVSPRLLALSQVKQLYVHFVSWFISNLPKVKKSLTMFHC